VSLCLRGRGKGKGGRDRKRRRQREEGRRGSEPDDDCSTDVASTDFLRVGVLEVSGGVLVDGRDGLCPLDDDGTFVACSRATPGEGKTRKHSSRFDGVEERYKWGE
jgi:hypothetical protein